MTNTIIAGHHHQDDGNTHQDGVKANPVLRGVAHVISYLFHPLFISVYVMGFLIFIHPYAFTGFDMRTRVFRFITIFFCNTFLPLFAIFLMWLLKLVGSLTLPTMKDRIIPYIVAMTFYWWTWMVFKNVSAGNEQKIPDTAIHFLLGAFLAICGGWICNIFFKISMHAIAMGGAVMFFLLLGFNDANASGLYIAVALLCAGAVCTSRLILSEHNGFEIWVGLFVGMFAQLIAWQF
jgi:hypothetical protein